MDETGNISGVAAGAFDQVLGHRKVRLTSGDRLAAAAIEVSLGGLTQALTFYTVNKKLLLREIQYVSARCDGQDSLRDTTVRMVPIQELRYSRDCKTLVAIALYEARLEEKGERPLPLASNGRSYRRATRGNVMQKSVDGDSGRLAHMGSSSPSALVRNGADIRAIVGKAHGALFTFPYS